MEDTRLIASFISSYIWCRVRISPGTYTKCSARFFGFIYKSILSCGFTAPVICVGFRFNRKDNLLRHKKTHLANALAGMKRRHTLVFGVASEGQPAPTTSEYLLAQRELHQQESPEGNNPDEVLVPESPAVQRLMSTTVSAPSFVHNSCREDQISIS